MYAIEFDHVNKIYPSGQHALSEVNFQVQAGDFYGLLGANGAGKSTAITLLCGLLKKTSGSIKVFGKDPDFSPLAIKRLIGYVPQEFNFNPFDRVDHILLHSAGYFGIEKKVAIERMDELLFRLGLLEKKLENIRALSGGMKRRLMIARALMHRPFLLLLDEPTAGVDVEVRRSTLEFLKELNQEGMTVLLTTHYLEEVERLCKNVGMLLQGKFLATFSIDDFLQQIDHEIFFVTLNRPVESIFLKGYTVRSIMGQQIVIGIPKYSNISHLILELHEEGLDVLDIRPQTNRLEELFLKLVQQKDNR